MDEWMLVSRVYPELLEMTRMSGEEDEGRLKDWWMGLPSLCLSSWWPVAGWGRIHNKQEQHKANLADLNDPKIVVLSSKKREFIRIL